MSDLSSFLGPSAGAPSMGLPGAGLNPTGGVQTLSAGFAHPNPLLVDPGSLTRQFQAIQKFNEVSSVPEILDPVTVDLLASPEIPDEVAMTEFLYGLEADLEAAQSRVQSAREVGTTPLVLPGATNPFSGTNYDAMFQGETGFENQFRRMVNDVAGNPFRGPQVVPGDPSAAVIDSKVRAIEAGYLPADTPLDSSWTRAMNSAAYQVGQDDVADQLKGNRFGAISAGGALDLVDRFLSPTSLLSTAIALDYVPNFAEIGRETSDWGKNIKSFFGGDDFSIGGFVKALGPIDDVVFPVMNLAMLATGVGGVVGFSRAALAARRFTQATGLAMNTTAGLAGATGAIKAGSLAVGGMKAAKAIDYMGDINRYAQPGLLGQALGRTSVLGAAKVSQGMGAWRSFAGGQIAKNAVAQGMKVGFVGEIEAAISPDRMMGLTINGMSPAETHAERIRQFKEWRTSSPWGAPLSIALEPTFTPVSMFRPGAITGKISGFATPIKKKLVDLTVNEALTTAMVQSADAKIAALPAADRAKYAKVTSGSDRLVMYLGKVDDPAQITEEIRADVGGRMLWLGLKTAIDKEAKTIARSLVPDELDVGRFESVRLGVVRHLENRLQKFDLDNFDPTDYEQMRRYIAHRAGTVADDTDSGLRLLQGAVADPELADVVKVSLVDPKDVYSLRSQSVDAMVKEATENPDLFLAKARQTLEHHDGLSQGTANDLFDRLDPEDLVSAFDEWGDSLANDWDGWLTAQGLLDDTTGALREHGHLVADFGDSPLSAPWASSLIGEELIRYLPETGPMNARQLALNPLQRAMTSGRKAVTVAKADTPTRQQAAVIQESVHRLLRSRRQIAEVQGVGIGTTPLVESLKTYAESAGKAIEDLTPLELRRWARATTETKKGQSRLSGTFGPAVQTLVRNGYSPDNLVASVDDAIEALNNADFWSKFRGVKNIVEEAGTSLGYRYTTLEEKSKMLRDMKYYLGAEISLFDVEDTINSRLVAAGYKVVVGDQFLQFDHLAHLDSPLAEVNRRHIQKMSFGTFMSREDHARLNTARRNKMEMVLRDRVATVTGAENWDGPKGWTGSKEQIDEIVDVLSSARRAGLEGLDEAQRLLGGVIPTTGTRMARQGVPFSFYETTPKTLKALLEPLGWGENSREILRGALLASRDIGPQFKGLASIGDKMAAGSWTKGLLRYMAYGEAADEVSDFRRVGRYLGFGSHRNEADLYRLWRAAGLATVGAGAGAVEAGIDGDNMLAGAAVGALAGGVAGAAGPGTVGRTAMRAGLGMGTAMLANEAGAGDTESVLLGLAASTGGFAALRKGAGWGADLADKKGILQYAGLYEPYERVRNAVRFGLSPVFDLQRYTEGGMLMGLETYKDANGVTRQLPVRLRPMKYVTENYGVSEEEIMSRFMAATRNIEWQQSMTKADAYLAEVGILGFSPTKNMASVHFQLVANGMDSREAVSKVKEIYQFGEKARSGLEQSVNFVFFPFSFQKHYLSKIASFANEDLGRLMLVHDSLKMYELLEERTEFHRLVDRHLPVFKQLRKINALAYGISPGQFGGINRPMFDMARALPGAGQAIDAFINGTVGAAFLPTGMRLETEDQYQDLKRVVRQSVPIYRDTVDLYEDLRDQVGVATRPSHLAEKHDTQLGYDQYYNLRDARDRFADMMGVSASALADSSDTRFESFRRWYEQEERRIKEAHPGFAASLQKATLNRINRQDRLRSLILAPRVTDQEIQTYVATGRTANMDLALRSFSETVGQIEDRYPGLDWWELPGPAQEFLRTEAIRLALDSEGFMDHYNRFFARDLGPIQKEVRP